MAEEAEVLTAKEACAFLRIDKRTLYKLLESGEIPARRVGHAYRIHKDVLTKYLKGESNE